MESAGEANPQRRSAHVRFTPEQFRRVMRDKLETGKSIPWLLKAAYFSRGISPPVLDAETRKTVRRELGYIGNNLNQLARAMNMGRRTEVEAEVRDAINALSLLKHFLLTNYGDR